MCAYPCRNGSAVLIERARFGPVDLLKRVAAVLSQRQGLSKEQTRPAIAVTLHDIGKVETIGGFLARQCS